MTILHLISSEGYYGAEAMLIELASNSASRGANSIVGAFRDARNPHTEVADQASRRGLPTETIPCNGRWDWKTVGRVRELVKKHKVDVLHTHGYKADFYGRLAGNRKLALLSTCHNWPDRQPLMRAYAGFDRWLLRKFDKVVAVSDSVAAVLLASGLPVAKLSTIPNGVDVGQFAGGVSSLRAERGWETKRLVGFVGRLVEDKGGAVLLRAAREVVGACPDVVFVLAGEGPLQKRWEAMAGRLGIGDHVVFLGARSDMPAVYASLDMLVLPSFTEAAPMCVLEALAAGKPVIATPVGRVPAFVIAGVNGILVEVGDAAAVAAAILRLIRDPGLARRLGENGQSHVKRHFSADAMAAAYLKLYEQTLASRRSPHARQLISK